MSVKKSPDRSGSVRIIAGRWRGRRVSVPAETAIRPTADRVRETLFNWLMPVIDGARCLDLYAGTGALGLEALSRGAAETWFVEKSAAAVSELTSVIGQLECETAKVVSGDALAFLKGPSAPFDIVFLDPPFSGIDLENLCTLLEEGWLCSGAHIYLELSRRSELPALPPGWAIVREKAAGEVRFALARKS